MKNNYTLIKHTVSFIAITAGSTLAMLGCNSNSSGGPTGGNPGASGETFYLASLAAVNPSLSTTFNSTPSLVPTGVAQFTLNGDSLTVNVAMTGLDASTTHLQFITLGSQCPTSSADINHDGVIDAVESIPSTGELLLPLNSDLIDVNNASFPSSDSSGNYTYNQTASYSQIVTALRTSTSSPSPSPSVSISVTPTPTVSPSPSVSPSVSATPSPSVSPTVIGTLPANGDLALNTRAVIIYGISSTVTLPSTVQSILGYPTAETVPVACGTIQQVVGLTGPSPTPTPSVSTSPSPTASPSASPSP